MKTTLLAGLAAVALAGLLSLQCGAAAAADIKRGGTITVGRPDEPLTLDPFIPSDNGSIYAIAQICEPLVSADADGTGLVPGLAASWTTSPGRPDLDLHAARRAELLRRLAGDARRREVLAHQGDGSGGRLWLRLPACRLGRASTDGKSVKIVLKQPYTPILSALSLFSSSVVKKSAYEAGAEAFGAKPVCTGPVHGRQL